MIMVKYMYIYAHNDKGHAYYPTVNNLCDYNEKNNMDRGYVGILQYRLLQYK